MTSDFEPGEHPWILHKYHGSDRNVTVPSKFSWIDDFAFSSYYEELDVIIPSTVSKVGNALYGCKSVSVPRGEGV